MPKLLLLATIVGGILFTSVTADAACSSMGGCQQGPDDQSSLLQSRALLSSEEAGKEDGEDELGEEDDDDEDEDGSPEDAGSADTTEEEGLAFQQEVGDDEGGEAFQAERDAEKLRFDVDFRRSSSEFNVGVLSYEDLPAHLQKLGDILFGSEAKVKRLIQNMSPIQTLLVACTFSDHGCVRLQMVCAGRDGTMAHLRNEMRVDRYALRKAFSGQAGAILDIGNIGDMAIASAKIHPHSQIIAFEPVPTTYFFLRLNLWLNNVTELEENELGGGSSAKPGVLALNRATTSDGRQVEIAYSDSSSENAGIAGNNQSAATAEATKGWSTAVIPSVVIQEFLSRHAIDHVKLFKIDCEGCEFEVVPAMGELFTNKSRVERIVGEVHQSLKDPGETVLVARPSPDKIRMTDDLLAKRGCVVGAWAVEC